MPAALHGLYIFLALLAGGLCLALPARRPVATQRRYQAAGLLVTSAGLIGIACHLLRWIGTDIEGGVFFVVFAFVAILGAVRVVTHRRPVYSAVYFVLVVLAVTGLCVLAAAEFLAAALVIVYGGAILVTYVFVIMLVQQAGEADCDVQAREPFAAVLMGFALLAATTQAMVAKDPIALHAAQAGRSQPNVTQAIRVADRGEDDAGATKFDPAAVNGDVGNVRRIGRVLVGDHMIAVQVAGILMLVAMVGAIAIACKTIEASCRTPHEQTQRLPVEPVGRHVEPFAEVEDRGNR